MKFAVIGAGFYGCSIALSLSEDYPNANIHLFEKESDIFKGAASNNQHRVHKGFHYPRSVDTIDQILNVYNSFKSKYSHLIKTVDKNYYVIDEDSKVSLQDYIDVYSQYNINYRKIGLEEVEPYMYTDIIQGGVITDEEVINLKDFKDYFTEQVRQRNNITINLNSTFNDFSAYDFVINCTYENPNLGLTDNKFEIKYESCVIPVVNNFFKDDVCITVMDGPFVSAYQDGAGNLTLSSVLYTPYFKTDSYSELKEKLRQDRSKIMRDEILPLMLHAAQYFKNMDHVDILKVYLSPKIKIKNDTNDLRTTDYRKEGNVISVLCGKISSIVYIYDLIKKEIDNVN